MSTSRSTNPLTYTIYYSFSAPTPAELRALLFIHNISEVPSNPLATTFIYHHVLDGSYTPFIAPIASHPYASIITIKEEDPSDEELSLLLRYPSSEPDTSSDSSTPTSNPASLTKCRTDPTLRCICKKCHA